MGELSEKTHDALRKQSDVVVPCSIEQVLSEWPSYGYRRVTAELRRRGIVVNHKRIARVRRENQLTVKPPKSRNIDVKTEHDPPCPNLARSMVPDGHDQLWVGDITYIRLRSGFVYPAVLIDAWSRKVVGYAVSQEIDVRLNLSALCCGETP